MKKVIFIFIVIIIFAAAMLWYFLPTHKKSGVIEMQSNSEVEQVKEVQKEVSEPGPLRNNLSQSGNLSAAGVLEQTNISRSQNGNLSALKENSQLDQAASAKLKDMFARQYFEHKNPQGVGVAELAKSAGYGYSSIGENLALGNYRGDADLLKAWMESPGHRANILNSKFTEIGIAVGKAEFEGKMQWLAVQEFGRPENLCPNIDANLKSQIESLSAEVKIIEPQVLVLKSEIDTGNPQTSQEYEVYNKKVSDYNALVNIYNNKIDGIKITVEKYNAEVKTHNTCATAN